MGDCVIGTSRLSNCREPRHETVTQIGCSRQHQVCSRVSEVFGTEREAGDMSMRVNESDHSTFSKNRHGRFRESDAFRHVFETVVSRCIKEGLVGGEGFAVDATLIAADANKQRSVPGSEAVDWPALAATRRSVQEYLNTLDEAAWGAASEVEPKFISRSDPAAQWTGALKGHAFFAYADNYLIDLKAAIIVDVEATRAIRQAEVGAAKTMIKRTTDRFGLKPERLAADSAYGSASSL